MNFSRKNGDPHENFNRWSTIHQVLCILYPYYLHLYKTVATPQVKLVSIAFRHDMTETLADFEKLYETENKLLTTEKYLRI